MGIVSPYLIAIGLAWITAHLIKYSLALYHGKKVDFAQQLFISGGMPSSHTATATSVWLLVGLHEGAQSAIFGVATLVLLIVAYDAVKVRRSVGEQGAAIQALIKLTKNTTLGPPRTARGHTPLEVVAGACLGLTIGLVVFFATI